MNQKKILSEKLESSVKAIDSLVQNIRDIQDYSEKSEIVFLLRELILEQVDLGENANENSRPSTGQAG
jgi:hypothetical protein